MPKEITHRQPIEVRVDKNEVVVEPPEIHGVRGFEVRLTPERARAFGHSLISAATQAMPTTTKPLDLG